MMCQFNILSSLEFQVWWSSCADCTEAPFCLSLEKNGCYCLYSRTVFCICEGWYYFKIISYVLFLLDQFMMTMLVPMYIRCTNVYVVKGFDEDGYFYFMSIPHK